MDQVKFVEDNYLKNWGGMVCLSRSHSFKFFKDCLPQILLGPFLNTLSHFMKQYTESKLIKYFKYSSKYIPR